MLEWLSIAASVIVIAILILAYFGLADVVVDLVTALAQLVVAAVALTITLLAALLNAVKRLLKQQNNAMLP